MGVEPGKSALHHAEALLVGGLAGELCLYLAVSDPCHAGDGVAVDGVGFAGLLHEGEGVDNGKKFTDVVGGFLERSDAENLFAGHQLYSPIFHSSGIAETGGIDCPAVEIYFRE